MNKDNERNIKSSLDKAKEIYPNASNEVKVLLESIFPELKDLQFPKSWKELCKIKLKEKGFCINVCGCTVNTEFNDNTAYKTTVSTEERAKKILLFQQLLEIRDYWNEIDNYKWKVDSNNNFAIRIFDSKLQIVDTGYEQYLFCFKTEDRAEKFMYIFEKELLQVLSI